MQRFPLLDQNRVTTFATAFDSPNTMTAIEIGLPIKVCWRVIPLYCLCSDGAIWG
jgi:hypothetical protein